MDEERYGSKMGRGESGGCRETVSRRRKILEPRGQGPTHGHGEARHKDWKKGDILCQNLQRGRGLSDGHGKAWFKDWREKKKVIICTRIFGEGGDSVSDGQGQIGSEDCKSNAAGGAVHEP